METRFGAGGGGGLI
ncbi:hypothetical protein VCEM1626_001278A, partial [Vibrio cholerae O1 str. EM-1626]